MVEQVKCEVCGEFFDPTCPDCCELHSQPDHSIVPVFRALPMLSRQVCEMPASLPKVVESKGSSIITTSFDIGLKNTIFDPRILASGGYICLNRVNPDGIRPDTKVWLKDSFGFGSTAEAWDTAKTFRHFYVPSYIVLAGGKKSLEGTRTLTGLQSAFNFLVNAVYNPNKRTTIAGWQVATSKQLSNVIRILADDFRLEALRKVVRFRVPKSALKVVVTDPRLKPGEIGLSPSSIRRQFGKVKPGQRLYGVVGRYPQFKFLPAKVVALPDLKDAIAVSPAWFKFLELSAELVRTFLDILEGDNDGDALVFIASRDATTDAEIEAQLFENRVDADGHPTIEIVPHTMIEKFGVEDLTKVIDNEFDTAIGKRAAKEYIRFIISTLYRSWIVFNLCQKWEVDTGLTRPEITAFWKEVSEGVFDLKHGQGGTEIAENILLCYKTNNTVTYDQIAPDIALIEKMPKEGVEVGRKIWEMPYLLGQTLGVDIEAGALREASSMCQTWNVLQQSMPDSRDESTKFRLAAEVNSLVECYGTEHLGRQMINDLYNL